ELAVREDVTLEEVRLARSAPVLLVRDAVVQEEAARLEQLVDASEVRRVVPDADVLDDPDRGDLVEAQARRQIPVVAVVDTGAPLEASAPDGRGGPLGLCGRERHAIGLDAVPLGGPHDQAPPAAAAVEQPVAGGQAELPAHEVELVRLRLVAVAVRVA